MNALVSERQVDCSVSHFGICVTDLQRSVAFYRDALGFAEGGGVELENQCNATVGLKDFVLHTKMMSLGAITIELLYFVRPETIQATALRNLNMTGLTHLALAVDKIEVVARRIEDLGGKVFSETSSKLETSEGTIELLYCADPDFTRIELIKYPNSKR